VTALFQTILKGNKSMHITKANTIWHSYTKVKAGKCYGIITKRVDGVVVLTVKDIYPTRKEAKKAIVDGCKRLSTITN